MATPRFFHTRISVGRVQLSAEESAHLRKSRRLRTGDAVELFDGAGREGKGRIVETPRSGPACVEVSRISDVAPTQPRIILATALPKGNRQDLLVEKCTELGVDVIGPVIFEHSVVKPTGAKQSKWRRTAIEAAKQCGRSWLPAFEPPVPFDAWLAKRDRGIPACVAHRAAGPEPTRNLLTALQQDRPEQAVCVVIGPEGGLGDEELDAMLAAGVTPVSLGPNLLRIETAAIVAVSIIRAWAQEPLTGKRGRS